MSNYGIGAYKKNIVNTDNKNKILLMLYQAAISNCKKAIKAIKMNDPAKKGEYINKMQDIIIELDSSLDPSVNEEICQELSSLYDYIRISSTKANIEMDVNPLISSLQILETLYDGWKKAIKMIKDESK